MRFLGWVVVSRTGRDDPFKVVSPKYETKGGAESFLEQWKKYYADAEAYVQQLLKGKV